MNFFGHSVVAQHCRPEPRFALGAMLPDLAHMLGCLRAGSAEPVLREGIDYHHLTDLVFHATPTFTALETQARQELAAAGVPRGARRALAHIGLEVLLDAELARIPDHLEHYLRALQSITPSEASRHIVWQGGAGVPEAERAFAELQTVLLTRAVHLIPSDARQVVDRLQRILARRPRLCLPDEHRGSVEDWVSHAWLEVRAQLPQWWSELRGGLPVGVAA